MASQPPFIVRAYSPTRRALFGGLALVLGLLATYAGFEWGRSRGGYDVVAAIQERHQLQDQVDALTKTNATLRAKAAELETLQASVARERAEVSRTIGELQAQVARQSQDLVFYKGLVVRDPNTPEVKIQQLHIVRGSKPLAYVVRLTLARSVGGDAMVAGSIVLSVAGQNAGHTDTLNFADLPFTLRYFQNLQADVLLPAGFKPERLQAAVKSAKHGIEIMVQSFIWTVEAN